MKKVIFLDRDGIINKRPEPGEYVLRRKNFILLSGTIAGLQLLSKNNFDIYIITNQPGIGRELMSENDLKVIHDSFLRICNKNKIRIKAIYYCPHKREMGCECRKPKPGMLLRAAKEHGFDITKAIFIGDDQRDKEAGGAAGCKTVLVESDGNLLETVQLLIK